jgi:amino acid adenylation domain-containing protein
MGATNPEILVFDTELKEQRGYWLKRLSRRAEAPSLTPDYDRANGFVRSAEGVRFGVEGELYRKLSKLTGGSSFLLLTTLTAALKVCLHKYRPGEPTFVGVPALAHVEGVKQPANALVILDEVDEELTFRQFLLAVRETLLEACAKARYPFRRLARDLGQSDSEDRCSLFHVALVLRDIHGELPEVKNDLTLTFDAGADGISGLAEYNAGLFRRESVELFTARLVHVLEKALTSPGAKLSEMEMLTDDERRRLLLELNDTRQDYPHERCAHELFEEQAAAKPGAVAVISEAGELSYGELNARANRLARHLRRLGVGPESRVGLMMERTPELVVALLATLKAGGAYVPLDPQYPRERIAFMLEDAQCGVLLTTRRLRENLPAASAARGSFKVVALDEESEAIAAHDAENLEPVSTPQNLAYVIYTSGSTGSPKGVMASHRGLVNYLSWAARAYRAAEGAGSPVHSPLGFDLTVTSLWTPLVSGRAAALVPEAEGVEGLAARLRAGGDYSLVKLTPAHLDVLGQLLGDGAAAEGARALVVGGEALRGESLRWWRERAPRVRVVNEYGPTEATVGCCVYEAEAGALGAGAVPIGRPIANTRLFVLDGQLGLTPPGLAGELYVGGDGLTRGYLRRPGLTAERFIPDAYSGEPGARLYRTGDVVRRLAGGDLEYVGRGDGQVKLRGYRVELGEVEAALLGHEEVREAAAAVHEAGGGDRRLVAYVVAEGGAGEEGAGRWREYLRERLPEYMIPSAFVLLDSLPLTPNGKLDRKALLELEPTHNVSEYVGPRTAAEEVVAGIWAEVLKTGRVGVRENFFALGGHSLLAMQVVSRVREVFGVKMSLRNVFEHPTIEELARDIDKAVRAERGTLPPPIVRAPRNGPLPVSFVQERIWQMAQKEGRPSGYNLAARFDGPLDIPALERALGEVVRRNEVLRTTFAVIGERPFQVINPPQPVSLTMVDLSPQPEAERQARVEQLAAEQGRIPFDLAQGPLLRFTLARLTEQSHVLLFTVAHIVCDHTSVKLLVAEVGAVYAAFSRNLPTPLPELDIQYPDYANWERQWLDGEVYETQVAYWRRQLAGAPPALQLPIDRPRPPVKTYRGAQLHFTLPEELSEAVGAAARREKATVFMVLLAAFKSLLYRYTGEPDMIVGTSAAGRTTHSGVERLVGNFGTPLALRTRPSGDTTYRELLRQVREASLEAYAHQDLTFDRVLEELKPEHDPSYMPLIQVGFVVHSMPSGEAPPPGELKMEVANVHSGRSVYDLSLRMHQTPQGLIGAFEYNIDLFERATLERMVEHFLVLLEGAVADPGRRLADLPLLTEAERARLLTQWGRNAENFSEEFSLGELAEQVGARVLYVLDADLNLVPAGVPGEVYLGDLSSPQDFSHPAGVEFVGDPFGVAPGGMLCKTGLRARFLPGGDLEFLGRAEQHVKVRGYNVDATQIDAALGQHPGVLQSVTRLREATADAPAVLGAYVVCRQPGSAEPEALRDFLKTRLPAYMIPSTFVMVEEPLGRQAAEHNEGRRD